MRQGRELEKLVSSLEKALMHKANVAIESPKFLIDKITGQQREHDVVITIREAHHTVIVAIECRDRSAKVTVPQIEEFQNKCKDTGINRGVIVSSSGFAATAIRKAQHYGIDCLNLEEVSGFDWLSAPGLVIKRTNILSNEWLFFPIQDGIVESKDFKIFSEDHTLIDSKILTENAIKALDEFLTQVPVPPTQSEVILNFSGRGLLLKNNSNGDTVPVKYAEVKICFAQSEELKPFNHVSYKEASVNHTITNAAYVDINHGNNSSRLMIVHNENEGGKVIIVPNCSKTPTSS